MMRYGLISLTVCFLLLSVCSAGQQIITTTDGRVIQGEVTVLEGGGYEVKTQFGVTTLSEAEVESMEDVPDPDVDYKERLEALAAGDVDGHIELAEWAEENDKLEESKMLFEKALAMLEEGDPQHRYVTLKIAEIEDELAGDEEAPDGGDPTPNGNGNAGGNQGGDDDLETLGLVSMDDVYVIRWKELHDNEGTWQANRRLNVKFSNNVLDTFEENKEGTQVYIAGDDNAWTEKELFDPRAFGRLSRSEKLFFIMANISRDNTTYSRDINILGDPAFMEHFREDIWPLIDNSCAQASCHGGANAPGGLRFLRPIRGSTSETGTRIYYTNFMTLSAHGGEDGLQLVDRVDVENSLLLQFGLPPTQARFKHPMVSGNEINAMFDGKTDSDYELIFDWIQNELHYPEPFYEIGFTVPGSEGGASSTPALDADGDDAPQGDGEEAPAEDVPAEAPQPEED
jgi:hypothetical protein